MAVDSVSCQVKYPFSSVNCVEIMPAFLVTALFCFRSWWYSRTKFV